MNVKKLLSLLLAIMFCFALAGCAADEGDSGTGGGGTGGGTPDPSVPAGPAASGDIEDVTLTVWGGEEDQIMLRSMIDEFIEANKELVNLTVNLGVESESTAKDTILTDITAAADVFAFADDQIGELYKAGALQKIELNTADVIARNGAGSVGAASVDGVLYAYPMTADNGYFMFYNSAYFTEDDIKSFDRMMAVAFENDKQITMDFGSGWYTYAFFKGAGLNVGLADDGVTNFCNWNDAPTGVNVVQSMLDIAANPGFISLGDAAFVAGIVDGSIIAGINGPWNAVGARNAWGDNYAAAKLPTFTLDGNQVQMASFAGFKLMGVNAFSENVGWAMLLADFLTNYDNQVRRFNERNQGPSNIAASEIEAVQSDPALAAIAAQAAFATPQVIGGNFWAPSETLGEIITLGNPDNIDLQTLLDNAVAGITAPVG
jgi:arabinogalactan oligomer/maltooligosaccharide transport system substrate-binding protein